MASLNSDALNHDDENMSTSPQDPEVDSLTQAVAKTALQDIETSDNTAPEGSPSRPLRVYTRLEILCLRKSPLVQPPDGMPSLKDWFGDWNEQQIVTKKDAEVSNTSTNVRERRFRRDVEDGDIPRPSFRSTLSQPSQMGNFRHQSLRTTDRDKDRDSERERERDLRDKEGQERLRNLSDKYDRDRLALSSSTNNLRSKERDSAPHLASTASNRLGQAASTATSTRRNEGRDPPKRKVGESSEDWRRAGPESSRASRDDRSDNSRKDRERPRSRARDSSRPRRDTSSSRRDRDERDGDRDRPRDRRGDGDRDRDEYRKDKDEYPRRERDGHRREWDDFYSRSDRDREETFQRDSRDRFRPRESERDVDDDPRRWRDDGKRDERVAARRERDRPWDRHEDRDRERPSASDDRDTRPRRGLRDRRLGGAAEDGKEREDRRERDRDREAEPAWMETYVPSVSGGGILGGRSADGELDGIQAWKKGMKERERQDKENEMEPENTKKVDSDRAAATPVSTAPTTSSSAPESQLDEIQLFKLMMKREADKMDGDKVPAGQADLIISARSTPPRLDSTTSAVGETNGSSTSTFGPSQAIVNELAKQTANHSLSQESQANKSIETSVNGSQSLLSTFGSSLTNEASISSTAVKPSTPSLEQPLSGSRLFSSRVVANTNSSGISSSVTHASDMSLESTTSSTSTFNPPPGSRLLAFGSRVQSGGSTASDVYPSKSHPGLDSPISQFPPQGVPGLSMHKLSSTASAQHTMLPESGLGGDFNFGPNARHMSESSRGLHNFPSHSHIPQSSVSFDELHDGAPLGQLNDLRRGSAVDRAAFGLHNETGVPFGEMGGASAGSHMSSGGNLDLSGANIPGAANYATGKGSRFAKFFDSKARDGQPPIPRKAPGVPSFPTSSPHTDPRQVAAGMMGTNGDTRTMEDIFAMLQSSAQNHHVSPQIPPTSRIPSGGSPYNQNHADLHAMQQQIHPQQHFAQSNHLDSLYDSRFDDRNFVPDGMVPGLRPAPPRSRSREPSGVLFNEQLDDPLHFNVRLQQQRNLEQMYINQGPPGYTQQQAAMLRNGGMPLQQQQFRGGPSPIANQSSLGGPSQRLPPGLANLGGRPPHDPSQYLGGPAGGLGSGLQGGLHGGSAVQQGYNNFGGGNLGFAGGPQGRGPPGPQNPLGMASMAGLGMQGNLDVRAASQAQLLGMGGVGVGVGGGLRGQGPGFGPQHGLSGQPTATHLAMRQQQQQQQQLPPHLMPHLMPPHLQQQQGLSGGNAQGAQDLMALLMGGHRD